MNLEKGMDDGLEVGQFLMLTAQGVISLRSSMESVGSTIRFTTEDIFQIASIDETPLGIDVLRLSHEKGMFGLPDDPEYYEIPTIN